MGRGTSGVGQFPDDVGVAPDSLHGRSRGYGTACAHDEAIPVRFSVMGMPVQ